MHQAVKSQLTAEQAIPPGAWDPSKQVVAKICAELTKGDHEDIADDQRCPHI